MIIIFAFTFFICLLYAIRFQQTASLEPVSRAGRNAWTLAAITGTLLLLTGGVYLTASAHGMHDPYTTYHDALTGIANSPREDKLPEDLSGAIIIYYRFDCPDCKSVYPELKARTDNLENLYFVDSRSPQGLALLQTYPVERVPSGIYISVNKTIGDDYISKTLYQENGTEPAVLDQEALDRLIQFQTEKR